MTVRDTVLAVGVGCAVASVVLGWLLLSKAGHRRRLERAGLDIDIDIDIDIEWSTLEAWSDQKQLAYKRHIDRTRTLGRVVGVLGSSAVFLVVCIWPPFGWILAALCSGAVWTLVKRRRGTDSWGDGPRAPAHRPPQG